MDKKSQLSELQGKTPVYTLSPLPDVDGYDFDLDLGDIQPNDQVCMSRR